MYLLDYCGGLHMNSFSWAHNAQDMLLRIQEENYPQSQCQEALEEWQ